MSATCRICSGTHWLLVMDGADSRETLCDCQTDLRERLGKEVRAEWINWAHLQPEPKASWLEPWDVLTEPEREVDRRIGERIYRLAASGILSPVAGGGSSG